jgi:hypothetical protein
MVVKKITNVMRHWVLSFVTVDTDLTEARYDCLPIASVVD